MHVVFLNSEYPPPTKGGIGVFTQTLARALVKQGSQVTVMGCYNIPKPIVEQDEGVTLMRFPLPNPRWLGIVWNRVAMHPALRDLHRRQPISLMEGHENAFAFLPKKTPYPRVIRMHGGHHFYSVTLGRKPAPIRSRVELNSIARANAFCAVSQFVGEKNRQILKLSSHEIKVLYNPVDIHKFCPRPHIPERSGLILFVGSLVEKKGIVQLVQAMPRIVAAVPHAQLWIYGRDVPDPATGGSMMARLKHMLPDTARDHVVFQGRVDHNLMPDALAQAQVAVYPSHMEAMPMAWLEAMAMGKAILASSTGPGPEMIRNGETGLLVDPHDPNAIAEGVIRLLQDAPLRARLGAAAHQHASQYHDINQLVHQNISFYERVIAQFLQEGTQAR